MSTTRRYPWWFLPVFSLLLGVGCLASFWVGGDARQGWISFAVLAGLGSVFAIGGRSELVRGLRGDGRDEYWEKLDVTATALAGMVLICSVIAMCFWEWGHGRSGAPYSQLGAIAGLAYVLALVGLGLRGEWGAAARNCATSESTPARAGASRRPRAGSRPACAHARRRRERRCEAAVRSTA
jgi:hypothetical protein